MSALAPVTEFVTGILPGAAVIGIAYIAAILAIPSFVPDHRKRRFYAKGLFLAGIGILAIWIWLYLTHLAPR